MSSLDKRCRHMSYIGHDGRRREFSCHVASEYSSVMLQESGVNVIALSRLIIETRTEVGMPVDGKSECTATSQLKAHPEPSRQEVNRSS